MQSPVNNQHTKWEAQNQWNIEHRKQKMQNTLIEYSTHWEKAEPSAATQAQEIWNAVQNSQHTQQLVS